MIEEITSYKIDDNGKNLIVTIGDGGILKAGTKVIISKEWFSVARCEQNPQQLFVFGDNTVRQGKGGQAQIRGCSNAIGIATKRFPTSESVAFFNDIHFSYNENVINQDINYIVELNQKHNFMEIVLPFDGFGTGLSKLPELAPATFGYLIGALHKNFEVPPSYFNEKLVPDELAKSVNWLEW